MRRATACFTVALSLSVSVLTACGPTPPATDQPDDLMPTVASVPEPEQGTPTLQLTAVTEMPGMPTKLRADMPEVVDFDVWQDFMPGPKTGNLIHSVLTIRMLCPVDMTAYDISGSVALKRADDSDLIASMLQVNSFDDTGTAGVKQISLVMQPVLPSMTLIEGEIVNGAPNNLLGGVQVDVMLPETELLFTH